MSLCMTCETPVQIVQIVQIMWMFLYLSTVYVLWACGISSETKSTHYLCGCQGKFGRVNSVTLCLLLRLLYIIGAFIINLRGFKTK